MLLAAAGPVYPAEADPSRRGVDRRFRYNRPMPKLRITMLLYGEIEHDSRVRREMSTLVAAGHSVTVATLSGSPRAQFELDGAHIVPLTPRHRHLLPGAESPYLSGSPAGTLRRLRDRVTWASGYGITYVSWNRAALRNLRPADVWHGHDLLGLLTARSLQKRHGGALVYDSHELFLESGSAARLPRPAGAVLRRLEGAASRAADAVFTVNPSIAAELHDRYAVDPVVLMNCPPLGPERKHGKLREHLGLDDRPLILYHGALSAGRGVEQLVEAIPHLPAEAVIVLLGYGDLVEMFAGLALEEAYRGRLYVLPAVPVADLPNWVCDADLGVILTQPVDKNNILSTPNKLFECMEAGVPVVVSDFPELRRIVGETGAGVSCDTSTPEAVAGAIRGLLDEPNEQKLARRRRARMAAEGTYNWAVQSGRLIGVYELLESRRGHQAD
jgi:glycosyltransferase involved in cell wall biosynthesis